MGEKIHSGRVKSLAFKGYMIKTCIYVPELVYLQSGDIASLRTDEGILIKYNIDRIYLGKTFSHIFGTIIDTDLIYSGQELDLVLLG